MLSRSFLKSGHTPTLFSAFLYFDLSFMVWVILGPLGVAISKTLHLDAGQKGLMVAVPVLSGAILRLVAGVMVDHMGPKRTGLIGQVIVMAGLGLAWFLGINNYNQVLMLGVVLGVAGASFAVALPLARAVSALHRAGVTHRDIKPDNVILETGGGLKLVDLGVARLRQAEEFAEAEAPGTAGYKAPEMYAGEAGNAATDQFALGVTLYRMFTRTYPWGEVDPADAPRFDRAPAPPTRHRPDMPAWLEAAILRAAAVDPDDRFEDVEELIHVLETGSAVAAPPPRQLSLIERDPVRFWQGVSLLLLLAFLISMATR